MYLSGRKKWLRILFVSWAVMKDIKVADGFSQGLSKPLKPQSQVSRSFNLNGVNPVIAMMFGDVSAREIYFLYSCNEQNTFKQSFLLQLVKSSCRRNQTMREEHILDSYLYSPTNFMYICKIQCRAAFFCKNTYYCANWVFTLASYLVRHTLVWHDKMRYPDSKAEFYLVWDFVRMVPRVFLRPRQSLQNCIVR